MRYLTLIRHAKSSWDHAELSDFERPLNPRGRQDAPEMARRMTEDLSAPLKLVSSPAVRALSTAQAFATVLKIAHADISLDARIYEATAGSLLEVIRQFDPVDKSVVMFGHNPGFSDLAIRLGDCPFREIPTCAVVRFAFDRQDWTGLNPGDGTLLTYRFPKEDH